MTPSAAAQALALKRVKRALGQCRAAAQALKAAGADTVDLVGEAHVTDGESLEQALNIVRWAAQTHGTIDVAVIKPDDVDPTTALQGQDRKAGQHGQRGTDRRRRPARQAGQV